MKTITIKGKRIRLSHRVTGETMPIAEDLLSLVGMESLCTPDALKRFFDLMEINPEFAIKFVSYHCDIRQVEAQKRIKRYFVIDTGIRITKSKKRAAIQDSVKVAKSYLSDLLDTWVFTDDLNIMLNEEGFNIDLINY